MKKDFGIIYVATGGKYIAECILSAKSAKKVMPNVPISLWSDIRPSGYESLFDCVTILHNPKYSFYDRIDPLLNTPYEKTLFVDTDTIFLHDVSEISTLLDQFDFAYCHAPWRICPGKNDDIEGIPSCFVEPNAGVLAYRTNDKAFSIIRDWSQIYSDQLSGPTPTSHDQQSLRQALYQSSARVTVLTSEYNLRTIYPAFKGGNCVVKILHGRGPSLSKAAKLINKCGGVNIFNFSKKSLLNRIFDIIKG